MKHRVKIFPLALGIASVLSLLLLIFPLSTQTSSFSLSLDLDNSEGDQAVPSLDVFPNRTVPIQIFGTDIGSVSDLSLRFEFDPTQVAYDGFKRSNIVSGTSALTGKDFANIGITLSAGNPISGLIGTIRFRTTEAFSGTDILLVRARLVRGGQTETVSMDLSVSLRIAKPPSPDFDRNGTVGIPDFLLFVDVFGSGRGQDSYESKYDLNVDGEIGIPDFLIFIDSFGKVVNRAPVFTSEFSAMLSVPENTPSGQAIGEPISATDGDGHTLTYRLSRNDADSFAIEESTGQIQTKGTYNFEQKDRYSVTVHVSDGEGGEASLAAGIAITDIDEPPEQPAPPSVSAIAPTTLTVIWTEPSNTGPEITDYDVQYRQADSDVFTDADYDGTERTVRLTELFSSTRYAIQVRATNEEGTSEWSESSEWSTSALSIIPGGGGTPPPPRPPPRPQPPPPPRPQPPPPGPNQAPTFTDGASTSRSVAENTTGAHNIGNPISATDPENTTLTYSLAGGDTDQFTIAPSIGQLRTQTGVDYNYEVRNRYSVTVEAQDDQGGRATITVTIDITDDDNERPERPDRPSVTASTLNSLSIRWTEPTNTGPNINDYDVQYRKASDSFDDWPHNGPGTNTTITSLEANTSYEVQVLARSPEGESQWSESVTVSTVANHAPTFNEGSRTTRRLAENTTGTQDIGNPITAADSDGGTLTYRLEGTDQASFALNDNQLQTRASETYDYEEKNSYEVTVRVEDDQGGSNTIEVTINLINQQEPPETPDPPSVSAASSTSLAVTWTEPANTGPDITRYHVQYRISGAFTDWPDTGPSLTRTITGLSSGSTYQIRVQAENAEGKGAWSNSVNGTTLTAPLPTILRGPYLQSGTSSSVIIKWRTDEATESVVHYGLDPNSLTLSASNATSTTEHAVQLTGLSADVKYFYTVGTSSATLAGGDSDHFVVTAPVPGTAKPTRIWVIGCSGTADANARDVRDAFLNFTGSRDPDLWIMLGDNAYQDGTDAEYQAAVFETYPQVLRKIVLWPTLGNHDGREAESDLQSGPYYDIFSLPRNGEAGGVASGTEAYYSFDYGNMHFIVLDSYETDRSPDGAMMTWLEADLQANGREWVIAFWHHAPYCKGPRDSDELERSIVLRLDAVRILERYGVDLVLAAHSHAYERSYLIDGHYGPSDTFTDAMKKNPGDGSATGDGAYQKPATVGAPRAGAVYVVAGTAGYVKPGPFDHPAMAVSMATLGSMVLDVNGNRLDAKFLDSTRTGAVILDDFTILKLPEVSGSVAENTAAP